MKSSIIFVIKYKTKNCLMMNIITLQNVHYCTQVTHKCKQMDRKLDNFAAAGRLSLIS